MKNLFKTPQTSKHESELKVSVFWGDVLYDTAVCRANESVTIGRNPENTFILDLPTGKHGDRFELVKVEKDHSADFFFDDELSGHLRFGDEILSLASAKKTVHVSQDGAGIYRAKLSQKDKADVVVGHVSFYLDWIPHSKKHILERSVFLTGKQKFLVLGAGLLAALLIWTIQSVSAPEPDKPPERLLTLLPSKSMVAKAAMGAHVSGDGGAQSGELGKAAVNNQEKPSLAAQIHKANLGSLISGLTSLGSNAPNVKSDDNAVNSNFNQSGTHGFSTEGSKNGGGGKSVGLGRTVGQGEGGYDGTGRLGLSGDSAVEGGTGYGNTQVVERGGLDRDVIDAIIRRRQDRIRLCYERQLNFNPKLSGKVSVHFVIGKEGTVLQSKINEDTMRNASVNSCILNEVGTWTFPKPQGGTQVFVDYPFVFESSAHT